MAVLQILVYTGNALDITVRSHYRLKVALARRNALGAITDSEWINELHDWEAIVWASYQIVLADYAIGLATRDPPSKPLVISPANEAQRNYANHRRCENPAVLCKWMFLNIETPCMIIPLIRISTCLD